MIILRSKPSKVGFFESHACAEDYCVSLNKTPMTILIHITFKSAVYIGFFQSTLHDNTGVLLCYLMLISLVYIAAT